jgi:hypothetical protein
MKRATWRAFLASSVLFLLSCAACQYGPQLSRIPPEERELRYTHVRGGGYLFGSEWENFGGVLFLASVSVAAGGAMRWWRESVVGETDLRTPLLDLGAASKAGATEETQIQDAVKEVPARSTATLTPTLTPTPSLYEPPCAHFDEEGRSPLERVLAEK